MTFALKSGFGLSLQEKVLTCQYQGFTFRMIIPGPFTYCLDSRCRSQRSACSSLAPVAEFWLQFVFEFLARSLRNTKPCVKSRVRFGVGVVLCLISLDFSGPRPAIPATGESENWTFFARNDHGSDKAPV